MNQLDGAINEEALNVVNPFEIPTDGPLQKQVAAGKLPPKTRDGTDIGTFGGRGGG